MTTAAASTAGPSAVRTRKRTCGGSPTGSTAVTVPLRTTSARSYESMIDFCTKSRKKADFGTWNGPW